MEPGLSAELRIVVEREDTAARMGSGDLYVLATPRLLAFAEAATVQAISLPGEQTSVGVRVSLEHLAASPVGMEVVIRAVLTEVDGRRLVFDVSAVDKHGAVVGRGTVERFVVDREKFLARLPRA